MADLTQQTETRDAGTFLCGVVVTFFPPADIAARLLRLRRQTDALAVIDNSGDARAAEALAEACRGADAVLTRNPRNLGIAAALNLGVAEAKRRGADWVVFFDQDTLPAEDFRASLLAAAAEHAGPPLGVIGCNYTLAGADSPAYAETGTGLSVAVDHVITSGSACPMAALDALGAFREDYFIDYVDIEFCWRALSRGYAVRRTRRPLLVHPLGDPKFGKIRGRAVVSSNHPPWRRYFIARNLVLTVARYRRQLPLATREAVRTFAMTVLTMCVIERDRRRKIAALLRGLWDGLRRRTDRSPADVGG